MHCLFEERIDSVLGTFELQLRASSTFAAAEPTGFETILLTIGHRVTIRRAPAPTGWLPAGISVERARAWLFYIEKRNTVPEQLTFSIRLAEPLGEFEAGPATGQWLTAIEFLNNAHQLHVGTQDEEMYAWQAGSLWVPKRLAQPLADGLGLIITDIGPDGLATRIPDLLVGEQFYFHYIMAEDPLRKSVEYPDEWDISTWYVVDQRKEKLEEAWSQQTKKPLP